MKHNFLTTLWSAITVPPKEEPRSSGSWLDGVELYVWVIVAVLALLLGVVMLAVFHQWLIGWRFRQSRKTAESAAKSRPRRFTGNETPRRK